MSKRDASEYVGISGRRRCKRVEINAKNVMREAGSNHNAIVVLYQLSYDPNRVGRENRQVRQSRQGIALEEGQG